MTDNLQKPMKWWGWGGEGEAPDFDNKPHLWDYITGHLGLDGKPDKCSPPPVAAKLPPPRTNAPFVESAAKCGLHLHTDDEQRLLHSGGKSFRDLWHARRGIIPAAPDAVVYLRGDADAAALIDAAKKFDIAVIPFGGGSNIAGCLTPNGGGRMIVAADTTTMNRLLSVNEQAQTAVMQTGALGGVLEEQLNARGWTFGHFPDSFLHSTLGGWIATRSAGMQSDEYGCIENLIAGLKVQTPAGEWIVKPHPRSAAAINQKEVVIGSEGVFGIITEAVIKVRPMPKRKLFYGYLFPDFAAGLAAVRECIQSGVHPLLSRLSDYNRTALSFAFRDAHGGMMKKITAKAAKYYMQKVRGVNFAKCCLMITAFEGDDAECRKQLRAANAVFGKHGGVFAGRGPGESFARAKFDFPHIRDYLWDYGLYADVSETATAWDNAETLRCKALASLEDAFAARNLRGWCGCHLSHSYRNGASLYFSFAFMGRGDDEENLHHYFAVKKAVQDCFAENGGTLSHHHSVGTDHLPWLADELSPVGIAVIGGIKAQTDPGGIMNPGKLRPMTFANWRAAVPVAE